MNINYNNAQFLFSVASFDKLPKGLTPEICFSGRSNVGKSTLINKIFNRKNFARVSSKPGKTVTVNYYGVSGLYFVDLPGYGYARVSGSTEEGYSDLIEKYFNSGRNIKLVFQLIDARRGITENDADMISFLRYNNIKFTVVMTKCDKLNKTELNSVLENAQNHPLLKGEDIILTSAEKTEGIEQIRQKIARYI